MLFPRTADEVVAHLHGTSERRDMMGRPDRPGRGLGVLELRGEEVFARGGERFRERDVDRFVVAGVIEIVQEARIAVVEMEAVKLGARFSVGGFFVDAHADAGSEHAHAVPAVVAVDERAMDFAGHLEIVGELLINGRGACDHDAVARDRVGVDIVQPEAFIGERESG